MSHFFHSQNVLDFSFLTSTIVDQVCKPWENFWNIRQVNFENSTPSKKKKNTYSNWMYFNLYGPTAYVDCDPCI